MVWKAIFVRLNVYKTSCETIVTKYLLHEINKKLSATPNCLLPHITVYCRRCTKTNEWAGVLGYTLTACVTDRVSQ